MKRVLKLTLRLLPRAWLIRGSYLIRPLLALALKGRRYQDPIDNRKFRKLLPYGYGRQRSNALSPSTLSLERHRLLWLYLERETDFFKAPHNLLHMAPEQAFYKRFMKMPNLKYTTADIASPLAQVKADITKLPFEDGSFDLVFCNHVLEHILDDHKAMEELFRVMTPGGWGIFQVPLDNSRAHTYEDSSIVDAKERAKLFGQYDHVRVYGLDYFSKLRGVGFEVYEVDYTAKLTQEEVRKYCLSEGELLPIVRKIK